MTCSFCSLNDTESWLKSYCVDCAMLKRMLVLHDPKSCVDILRRCLIRNENQIAHKIKMELKAQDKEVKNVTFDDDSSYIEQPLPPLTRSKHK